MDFNVLDNISVKALGKKLQQARKQKGLTQQDVAELIDAARTTITAIEKGERRIKADELIKLARAYGCQVSDFVRPRPEMESFAIQFRSARLKSEADDQQITQYVEEFESLCRDYLELEEITASAPFRNYPSEYRYDHLSVARAAETVAQQERNRLGLGDAPIHSLRELLEREVGLRIFYMEMKPSDKFSAMYTYSDKLGGAIAVNRLHEEERRRFSLAHDYAHFLVHRHKAEVLMQDGYKRRPESEQFADQFAVHFLMPTLSVTRSYNAMKASQSRFTLGDLLRLAYYFGVSFEAMALRLEGLKLLPTGTFALMQSRGVNVKKARQELNLQQSTIYEDLLPKRYQVLAVQAYTQEEISEGQLAHFLRVNRLVAREVVALLQGQISSLLELPAQELSEAMATQGE